MCAGHARRTAPIASQYWEMDIGNGAMNMKWGDLSSGFFKFPFALLSRAEHRLLTRNGSELKRFDGGHPVGGDHRSLMDLSSFRMMRRLLLLSVANGCNLS